MLRLPLSLFGATMLLGFVLAAMNLRQTTAVPPWFVRLAHGLLGAGGLAVLMSTTSGPVAGDPTFRLDAVVLLGAALLLGLAILGAYRIAPKSAGALIALHATIAMFGLAVLSAYATL